MNNIIKRQMGIENLIFNSLKNLSLKFSVNF